MWEPAYKKVGRKHEGNAKDCLLRRHEGRIAPFPSSLTERKTALSNMKTR
jgi:hypothetical protein